MLKKWHTILKSRVLVVIFFVASDLLSLKSCIFSLNYTLFNMSAINFQNCVILKHYGSFSLSRRAVLSRQKREKRANAPQRKYGNVNLRSRESISLSREQSKMSVRDDETCVCVGGSRKTIKRSWSRGRGDQRRAMKHIQWRREWVSVCACVDVSLCWF